LRWRSSATITVGRSFLQPSQLIRDFDVRVKLNLIKGVMGTMGKEGELADLRVVKAPAHWVRTRMTPRSRRAWAVFWHKFRAAICGSCFICRD